MTLTKSYIDHQVKTLGSHTREALAQYDDPALTERTVLFDNLKQCGGINRKYDAGVIAQTMANILDARAWEDYLDVDGSRKSCPSFAEWLDRNGVDITLAEFAINEKKPEYCSNFTNAVQGRELILSPSERGSLGGQAKAAGKRTATSATTPVTKTRRKTTDLWRQRLEREAVDDPVKADLLTKLNNRICSITSIAVQLGWHPSALKAQAQSIINRVNPKAKEYLALAGLDPEDLIKRALEEFVENHPDPQNL